MHAVSSVQNDIWTLLVILVVGVVPLGVALFMLRRPKPFEPPTGGSGEPPAGREALFENEITSFKDDDFEEPQTGQRPLSWKERLCYTLSVMLAGCALSAVMFAVLRLLLAKGIYL
jgi:hypothetical protein